jgi:ubiquinone/menaquinone biosynthesis C-methylase UbiE
MPGLFPLPSCGEPGPSRRLPAVSERWRDVFHHEHGMRDYDEILVPRMFTPWGEALLDAVGVDAANVALDVACGPGTVTRLLSERVGPTGRVTGADLSPAMLEIARERGTPHEGGAIDWLECPADALAVENHTCDVIVCQQGLQFFPDKPAALREMHRAGRHGARLGVACWSSIDESPMFAAMARALDAYFANDAGNLYRAGPFGLTDAGELARLVKEAGFRDVRVERLTMPVTFDDAVAQLITMAAFMPPAALLLALDDTQAAEFVGVLEGELGPMLDGDSVTADTTTHLALATA